MEGDWILMNESNYGDLVWDFVERLIEEKKDEK